MSEMTFQMVDIKQIEPNPYQPRLGFDEKKLQELADSLRSVGEIQPIIVRKADKKYQIIAGERRWKAAKLAGLTHIPVLIKDTPEENLLLESLIENLHRADLTSVERENAVYELWKTKRWNTQEELSNTLGKSSEWVSENILAAVTRKREKIPDIISTSTIKDTAVLEPEDRKQIITKVEKGKLPARRVREYAKVVKDAPETIKKAVLKEKSRITPRVAEKLIDLPKKEQTRLIDRIESLRLEEDEALMQIQAMKTEVPPQLSEKEVEFAKERLGEIRGRITDILEKEEVKEKGRLFRNWLAHQAILDIVGTAFCPICGANWEKLEWSCHHLRIDEAYKAVADQYQQAITVDENYESDERNN